MPVLGNSFANLAEVMKRQDPNNQIAAIIEMLAETNEIMADAITVEGNLPTGHRTTVRTGLPNATWRTMYKGVQPSKSTTKQVDDSCGMLEAYSQVDKALADLNGNTGAFRLSEASAFIEAMNQEMAETLFYGNTDTNPEKYMGLDARFSSLSADKTKSGSNIVNAGGTGADNTSIYIVTWGENTCHLTYPKGSQAGLQRTDKGQVTVTESDGSMWEAYREHFKWDLGLVVRDWRGIARVANIDVSEMAAGNVALDDLLIEAYYKVRKRPGKKAIYCNEQVMVALHKLAKDKANVNLSLGEWEGREVVKFLGIPVRECEAITANEAAVS